MENFNCRNYKIYNHFFANWKQEVHGVWTYDDFKNHPDYKKEWVSLTSLVYHKPSDSVYVGIGSFAGELLWKLDRKTGKLTSCGYEKIADYYDGKFHRSLEIDGDTIYAGVALYHDIDKQFDAKGGRIVKYDIPSGKFEFLATPMERIYIQSMCMDKKEKKIYGCGASPEVFWEYDIKANKSRLIAYVGSGVEFGEPHNVVLDEEGNVWGTYGILRAMDYDTGWDSIRLFRYEPKSDKMTFFKHTLPRTAPEDKGKIDIAINGNNGYLYIGTDYGNLCKLDIHTAEATYLGHPGQNTRLAALGISPVDGLLYGVAGDGYKAVLFAMDMKTDQILFTEEIMDDDGVRPARIHFMTFASDGTIYLAENDNEDRSGYLWEVKKKA